MVLFVFVAHKAKTLASKKDTLGNGNALKRLLRLLIQIIQSMSASQQPIANQIVNWPQFIKWPHVSHADVS